MATTYGLAPNARYYVINQLGVAAANGVIVTRDAVTGAPKPTYRDPAGITVNPTAIRLGEDGSPGYPLYWQITDGQPLYRIDVYAANGSLIYEEPNYPIVVGGNGGGDVTVNNNVVNYFQNPQFIFWNRGDTFTDDELPIGSTEIADMWYYTRSTTNAEVSISKQLFNPGENAVPFSPPTYLKYSCTTPGADTTNFVSQRFQSVQMLTNQIMTDSIYATVLDLGGASTLTLIVNQYFGAGGSTTVSTTIDTYTLDDTWQQYSSTFTVPDITGKSIGTGGDDYLEIAWQFQSNQAVDIGLVDVVGQSGTGSGIDFPYISPDQQYSELLPDILSGHSPTTGTDIIGTGSITTPAAQTQTLTEYLQESFYEATSANLLIGWNFLTNPNQFGATINPVVDATYIADQTIGLSDGAGIFSKSSTVGKPLALTVLITGKKFGIFQIVETINSSQIFNSVVSMAANIATSAPTNLKMALIGWSGTVNQQLRDPIAAWNIVGTDPSLSTGWNYVTTSVSFAVDTAIEMGKQEAISSGNVYSSYGVLVWNDVADLIVGDTLSFYKISLVEGINASNAENLDEATVLSQCQRYYEDSSYPFGTVVTGVLAQGVTPQQGVQPGNTGLIDAFFPANVASNQRLLLAAQVSRVNFAQQKYKMPVMSIFNSITSAPNSAQWIPTFTGTTATGGSFSIVSTAIDPDFFGFLLSNANGQLTFTNPGTVLYAAPILFNYIANSTLGV